MTHQDNRDQAAFLLKQVWRFCHALTFRNVKTNKFKLRFYHFLFIRRTWLLEYQIRPEFPEQLHVRTSRTFLLYSYFLIICIFYWIPCLRHFLLCFWQFLPLYLSWSSWTFAVLITSICFYSSYGNNMCWERHRVQNKKKTFNSGKFWKYSGSWGMPLEPKKGVGRMAKNTANSPLSGLRWLFPFTWSKNSKHM